MWFIFELSKAIVHSWQITKAGSGGAGGSDGEFRSLDTGVGRALTLPCYTVGQVCVWSQTEE